MRLSGVILAGLVIPVVTLEFKDSPDYTVTIKRKLPVEGEVRCRAVHRDLERGISYYFGEDEVVIVRKECRPIRSR